MNLEIFLLFRILLNTFYLNRGLCLRTYYGNFPQLYSIVPCIDLKQEDTRWGGCVLLGQTGLSFKDISTHPCKTKEFLYTNKLQQLENKQLIQQMNQKYFRQLPKVTNLSFLVRTTIYYHLFYFYCCKKQG